MAEEQRWPHSSEHARMALEKLQAQQKYIRTACVEQRQRAAEMRETAAELRWHTRRLRNAPRLN